MQQHLDSIILGLDIGSKRIGVAIADLTIKLPRPLLTLTNDEHLLKNLQKIIQDNDATKLVIGLPRGLEGQETQQTIVVRDMAQTIINTFKIEVIMQDEALTSIKAKEELMARGKIYTKGDVDSLAATYILEDYLNQKRQ